MYYKFLLCVFLLYRNSKILNILCHLFNVAIYIKSVYSSIVCLDSVIKAIILPIFKL